MSSRLAQTWETIRRNGPGFGREMLVNAVLPLVIYSLTDKRLGDVDALIASSVPPIAWSIVQFVRSRRLDAFSLLIVTGIAFSLLALLGGGGARFLQLRESLVTGVIGVIFLVSAAIGRPLVYHLARASMMRNSPSEAESFEAMRESALFKHTMMVMTIVWGLGLVARTAAAGVLVFSVPIPTYLALHSVLGYASTGALTGWTFWYARRRRRLGAERRAAEAAVTTTAVETPLEAAPLSP
jgi:hypothetical protein